MSGHPSAIAAGVVIGLALTTACTKEAGKSNTQSAPATQSQSTPAAQQSTTGKEHVLRGKVEQIDAAGKLMSVNNENVEGWMPPMTMSYKADNADIFSQVKVGDQITATVYDGDFTTLHNVQIVH